MAAHPSKRPNLDTSGEEEITRSEILELRTMMERVTVAMEGLKESNNGLLSKFEEQEKVMKNIHIILERQEDGLKKIKDEISKMTNDVKEVRERVKRAEEGLDEVIGGMSMMKKKIGEMEMKMIDVEARGRRNNLLFFGLQEEKGEDCFKKVKQMIKNDMGIKKDMPLIRCHRLGPLREHTKQPRPIITAFLDFRDKETVRMARSQLSHPKGVGEDFPLPIRKARESLRPELAELKKSGRRATIAYPARLIDEGKVVKTADILAFNQSQT